MDIDCLVPTTRTASCIEKIGDFCREKLGLRFNRSKQTGSNVWDLCYGNKQAGDVKVQLVTPGAFDPSIDLDVNSLCLTKGTLDFRTGIDTSMLNFKQTLYHIFEKKCLVLKQIDPERKQKFLRRGWTVLQKAGHHPGYEDVVLRNLHVHEKHLTVSTESA
mmetsp:Transcript_34000/g.82395  ORF Transcript_34000/g.82395 Transcript_34000/m.82395 type:complete len:161 (+) Transcript_34000:588-1070(+)